MIFARKKREPVNLRKNQKETYQQVIKKKQQEERNVNHTQSYLEKVHVKKSRNYFVFLHQSRF